MKYISFLLVIVLALALYFTYRSSESELELLSTEAYSYQIDTLSTRLERIFDNIDLISENFDRKNGDINHFRDYFLWNFSSISFIDSNGNCYNSTNHLNIGKPLDFITFAPTTSPVVISDPYLIDINGNKNIFIDLLYKMSDDDWVIFKLNTNQIQTVIGSNIFTFIQDTKTKCFVHPYIPNNDYKEIHVTPDNLSYLREEYGTIKVSLPHVRIPPAIEETVVAEKFDSDKFVYSYITLNKYDWKIIQVSISHVDNYSIFLIFGVCVVAIGMLVLLIKNSNKQLGIVNGFMEKQIDILKTKDEERANLIARIGDLVRQFDKSNDKFMVTLDKIQQEKDLANFLQKQENHEFLSGLYNELSLLESRLISDENKKTAQSILSTIKNVLDSK